MKTNRVDGHQLGQSIGEQVILLGTVTKKSQNGRNIEMTTTDGVQVNVTLSEPMDGNADGYIEVRGVVQSKSTISCSSYVTFPPSMTEKFDVKHYNGLVQVLTFLGPRKWISG